MSKQIVKVICEIKVPFHDYGKASLNKRVVAKIKREIRWTLEDHCRHVELDDIEKDEDGIWNQDCSYATTIKVKGDLM